MLSEAVFVLIVVVVVIVIVIEEIMQFGHEQLDVYRVSLEYAVRESWAPYGDYDNDNECCRFQLIGFSVPC
ncbi:MAG: hypothetical protein JRF65_09400 [Deltaproteobacteria bacterium]|nr:hypothetical protein [Deltaproteobacteria bacterium]MBW2284800.1 hypothetical protein [Deltaproteobacteria bacterium]